MQHGKTQCFLVLYHALVLSWFAKRHPPGLNPIKQPCVHDLILHWSIHRISFRITMPRCSMYGIFAYIWVIFGVNVGKYSSTMEHMGCEKMVKFAPQKAQLPRPLCASALVAIFVTC